MVVTEEGGSLVPQTGADIAAIAGRLVRARHRGEALPAYPGEAPANLQRAYAIQDAAIPLYGDAVAGWKVGRINPPWQDELGTDRLAGPIFARSVLHGGQGASPRAEVFAGGFGAAEAEFVVRIGRAPPEGKMSFATDEAAALVDAVFAGIEIASSPYGRINADGPLVTISDFGNNNGLVIGEEIPDWQSAKVEQWPVRLFADGVELGTGTASAFPGGLRESVRFLLENIVARGLPVRPGLLISTGAVTGVHAVRPGQSVEARFGDFCSVHCRIGESGHG